MICYKYQMTRFEQFASIFGLEPDDLRDVTNQEVNTLDFIV